MYILYSFLHFYFDLVSFTFFISLHFQSIPSLYLCSSRRSQHTGSECSGMSSVSRESRNTREVGVGLMKLLLLGREEDKCTVSDEETVTVTLWKDFGVLN